MNLTEVITRFYCQNAMERSSETNVRNLIQELIHSGEYITNVEFWRRISNCPTPEGERILQWTWADRR